MLKPGERWCRGNRCHAMNRLSKNASISRACLLSERQMPTKRGVFFVIVSANVLFAKAVAKRHRFTAKVTINLQRLGSLRFLFYRTDAPEQIVAQLPNTRARVNGDKRMTNDVRWSVCLQHVARWSLSRRGSSFVARRPSHRRLYAASARFAELREADGPTLRHLSHRLCRTDPLRPPLQD
jgi:hypothetical protein